MNRNLRGPGGVTIVPIGHVAVTLLIENETWFSSTAYIYIMFSMTMIADELGFTWDPKNSLLYG